MEPRQGYGGEPRKVEFLQHFLKYKSCNGKVVYYLAIVNTENFEKIEKSSES